MVQSHWKDKFVADIKPSDVHRVIFEDCVHVSSYTKRGLLKIVKRVFNIAIEEALLVRNPAVGIRVRCAVAHQAVLNKNEIEILLREAKKKDHQFYPHWTLALLTGMSSGELYSLRWSDVDLVSGKITISKAWTRHNGEGPTKTAKNRIYPISSQCRKFLEDLKLKSATNSDFVLPHMWEWQHGSSTVDTASAAIHAAHLRHPRTFMLSACSRHSEPLVTPGRVNVAHRAGAAR